MEAHHAAEFSSAVPQSPSPPSSCSTQRTHLPVKGAFSEFSSSSTHRKRLLRRPSVCRVVSSSSLSSSTLQTRTKFLPRTAFSDHRVYESPPYSSSFSSSSTQQAVCRHLPRKVISDCHARKLSLSALSSSMQYANRKHLSRVFPDSQVQGFRSSQSIQHVRRKHLLRAFSDFHVSSSLLSSTTWNMKRKHLPRAFMDYLRFSSFLSTKHVPKAFSNYHTHLGFKWAEQQQPPTLSVRTAASVGGLSGGIHGSNSRKGRRRRHPHQGNSQELENMHEKEIRGDNDSHMYCDDVPYNKDSDSYIHCDDVPYDTDSHMFSDNVPFEEDYDYVDCKDSPSTDDTSNSTGSLITRTCMYDSIHGGLWQNDPYYQEFEKLEIEIARRGVSYGFTPDRSTSISIVSEQHLLERLDVENSQNNEYMMAVQGGKGVVVAHEFMDISDSMSATATEGSTSLFKETCESVKEPFSLNSFKESTVQGFVGTLERDQNGSLDYKKSLPQQDGHGKGIVREVKGGERPLTNVGSLQNVEGTFSESRHRSGSSKVDGIDLVRRSLTEIAAKDVVGSVGGVNTSNVGAYVDGARITNESDGMVTEVVDLADAMLPVVEQVGQVAELISDSIKEHVVNVVENLPAQVAQVAEQVMSKVVDQVAEVLPDPVVEQVGQVAEQVTQTAEQIVEQVASQVVEPISTTASQIVNLLSSDDNDEMSDDEFEAYTSLDIPEFKGRQGLDNFTILQEQDVISVVYDFYIFMLKRSPFEFTLGMFAAPILVSMLFTILYLPEFNGLALDETVRQFMQTSDVNAKEGLSGLQLSWETVFQVFMFSVSLSTGLQPELAPLSPYTLVVANLNALVAQLIFVFLSGAVFARLSQPSQPVKFSTIAIICPPPSNRRLRKEACHKALLTRYILVGPQPCELVDVKVDLTYTYNTVTRSGTFFRTSQSLKLVRPEIAFLTKGMLVRHIIDETSPLYQRTQEMLEKEDAVFTLSVVGLERSSMQSVFHVQHYCVYDKDVIWDAEFVDMILISKKNKRVVDHSLLSKWRSVAPS